MKISRRRFCALSAAAGGALWVPGPARAGGGERKFLFLFCEGGWDPTMLFAPAFDSSYVDMEEDVARAEVGGLSFVDSPQRPTVRSFLEAYADRTCFINGMEVRSITHERCTSLLLTGQPDSGVDDWPALLAAHSSRSLLLPHLVMSGPSFSAAYTSLVVRAGSKEQLVDLMDGTLLRQSDMEVPLLEESVEDAVDAFVRGRVAAAQAADTTQFSSLYSQALDQHAALLEEDFSFQPPDSSYTTCGGVFSQIAAILNAFEQGFARCGMVAYKGWCSNTFDTHSDNQLQSTHFEELFMHLEYLMGELAGRPGSGGGTLADEVTVVVCSEMGRHPQYNSQFGKDHWTFTSAMLVGAGVRGGQVIGAYDEYLMGGAVDLSSGAVTEGGVALTPGHLGATLLALGDVDPGEYTDGAEPIAAVLK
jgi:uncharacterized protein (DUF1501 family)